LEIIRKFEEGTINVLISTSVSEEGISIKGVDTAVFYETVSSAIRMIQRKGRVGRFDVGKIYLLIAEDTNDEGYFWLSKRREKAMRKIVSKIKDNPSMITNDGTLRPFT
jgi:Fanconi anemia group M protein